MESLSCKLVVVDWIDAMLSRLSTVSVQVVEGFQVSCSCFRVVEIRFLVLWFLLVVSWVRMKQITL